MKKVSKTGSLIFIFKIFCYEITFSVFFQAKMLVNSKTLLVGDHSFKIVDSKLFTVINIGGIYVKLITRWTATGKVEKSDIILPSHL